jgi:hypothetical protein
VNTFLNCTMPEFANIRVGSFFGTSDDDATTSCPSRLKKFRNVDLISLTPLIERLPAAFYRLPPPLELAQLRQ